MAKEDRGVVAITGANGSIGYACTVYAVCLGYRVRCVVRSKEAIETLRHGPSLQRFASQIDYHIVPDNTVPDSYDSALADVQYVIHIAGVWPTPDKHPDNDIYIPFVKSMQNILSAAEKVGTVKRVVFTQAGAAMVHPDDGDTLGTAMDMVLNEYTPVHPGLLSLKPPLASPHHAYCAAKAQCMTTLKNLRASGNLPFSIVQVVPGTVMGPSELVSTKMDGRGYMDRMSRALLFNEPKPRYSFGFVHVGDVARVHVEALDDVRIPYDEVPDWFIAAGASDPSKDGEETWKEAGDFIENNLQHEVASGMFSVGRDKVPTNMPYYVDSALTETKLLRHERFKSLKECIKEVAEWYTTLR
ncbi:hypothetical protein DPSP01_012542 [Paraphaeosphaeria sporulosa]